MPPLGGVSETATVAVSVHQPNPHGVYTVVCGDGECHNQWRNVAAELDHASVKSFLEL